MTGGSSGSGHTCVILAEELHAHDGEYEYDNAKDDGEVPQSAHCAPHDGDQQVERGPGLGQLEYAQLQTHALLSSYCPPITSTFLYAFVLKIVTKPYFFKPERITNTIFGGEIHSYANRI